MRELRADDRRMPGVRDGLEVVDEAPFATEQRLVLDPEERATDPCLTLGRDAHGENLLRARGVPTAPRAFHQGLVRVAGLERAKRVQHRARVAPVTLGGERQRLAHRAAAMRAGKLDRAHQPRRAPVGEHPQDLEDRGGATDVAVDLVGRRRTRRLRPRESSGERPPTSATRGPRGRRHGRRRAPCGPRCAATGTASTEARRSSTRQAAEVTIYANGSVIRAEESSENLYASIDLVADKIARQLRKYKERRQDQKTQPIPTEVIVAESVVHRFNWRSHSRITRRSCPHQIFFHATDDPCRSPGTTANGGTRLLYVPQFRNWRN